MSEHDEQVAVIQWAAMAQGRFPELALLLAIPNGGARHIAVATKLKAEGVRPGVPDLFLPYPNGGWHGLWIEMKTTTGRPSESQKWWLAELRKQWYSAVVCYGAEEAIGCIKEYFQQ